MNTGIPGTGLATIFYVLSVLLMPAVEVGRSIRRGAWQAAMWRKIARYVAMAGTMALMLYGTVSFLIPSVDARFTPLGRFGTIAVAIGMLALFLLLTTMRSRTRMALPVWRPLVGSSADAVPATVGAP